MTDIEENELLSGLRGLVEGLSADGYTVDAHWAPGGNVQISIGATPEACPDCLVPKDIMRGIAATMLTSAGVSVTKDKITVIYPEGAAAH